MLAHVLKSQHTAASWSKYLRVRPFENLCLARCYGCRITCLRPMPGQVNRFHLCPHATQRWSHTHTNTSKHARMHARTHARMHARTHACMHARARAHTHTLRHTCRARTRGGGEDAESVKFAVAQREIELAAASDDVVPCLDDRSVTGCGPLEGTCQIFTRPPFERVVKMERYGWKLPCASACVCERTTRWPSRPSRAVFQKSTMPLCRVAARLVGMRGWCETETTAARSSFGATLFISRAEAPHIS